MPDNAVSRQAAKPASGARNGSSGRREFAPPTIAAKTRPPTGRPAWPRILMSGEEGSRKSWTAALLSADERLASMFWLEIGDGETTADEYGAIPGVRYGIIEHDGTWRDIMDQLAAHWQLAKDAEAAGTGPIGLTTDAMSGVHSMLKDMADTRARRRLAAQLASRKEDPDQAWSSEQEVLISVDLWNLIKKRHGEFMHYVQTWPGPVVLISAEDIATVFDEKGQPTKEKTWTLQCRKDLPKQVNVHIRTFRGRAPEILKLRSANAAVAVNPEKDNFRPVQRPGLTLADLIFNVIGCDKDSRAPLVQVLDADQAMPDEAPAGRDAQQRVGAFRQRALAATSREEFSALWAEIHRAEVENAEVKDEAGQTRTLRDLIHLLGSAVKAAQDAQTAPASAKPEPATTPPVSVPAAEAAPVPAAAVEPAMAGAQQLTMINAKFAKLGVGDPHLKLTVANVLANRPDAHPLRHAKDLTLVEANTVIGELGAEDAADIVAMIIRNAQAKVAA